VTDEASSDRPGNRIVVHVDLDAFYASVEQLDDPALRGKPLIVGGRSNRGVVTTASYEAREFGIRSGMPTYQALRRCPHVIVVPPRFSRYSECSRAVMAIMHQAAPVTQPVSIDEAYLELTDSVGEWSEGVERASALQAQILQESGLSASVGVAASRLVAKVASDRDKPGGFTVVPPGTEATFLAPLPVRVLWGVGPVTAARLEGLGIVTVGDIQDWSREDLWEHLGKRAEWLLRQSRGDDDSAVSTRRRRKSISRERTFGRNLDQECELLDQVRSLSEGLVRRLARSSLAARTIALKIRYSDFTTLTRQMRLTAQSRDVETVYLAAAALFRRAWEPGRPVRLLGVSARDLRSAPDQPRLPWLAPADV
jgi:DNA polymerase-4